MTAFFYFWLSLLQETTKCLSFPNPVHTTLEKQNLLKLPKVVFKNHNTAFELKNRDFRNYQMFLHCTQHKHLNAFVQPALLRTPFHGNPRFQAFSFSPAATSAACDFGWSVHRQKFTTQATSWTTSYFQEDLSLQSVLWITIAEGYS